MAAILITGMSGTGKSTALRKLAARGHPVVDTDDPGWCRSDGDEWVWDEERMTRLLDDHDRGGRTVFVQGTVSNQKQFYPRFDDVVLLTAPLGVLLERIAARNDNPYGKSDDERAEIERNLDEVQPLLQSGASVELDATAPVNEIADTLERLIRTRTSAARLDLPTQDDAADDPRGFDDHEQQEMPASRHRRGD